MPEEVALDALLELKAGAFAKEALAPVVQRMLDHRERAADAAKALGLSGMDESAVVAEIDRVIAERAEAIRKQGARASGMVMGPVVAKFRGKVPGETISKLVEQRLATFLAS